MGMGGRIHTEIGQLLLFLIIRAFGSHVDTKMRVTCLSSRVAAPHFCRTMLIVWSAHRLVARQDMWVTVLNVSKSCIHRYISTTAHALALLAKHPPAGNVTFAVRIWHLSVVDVSERVMGAFRSVFCCFFPIFLMTFLIFKWIISFLVVCMSPWKSLKNYLVDIINKNPGYPLVTAA